MKTKRFAIDFLAGIAPAFFVAILPMYLASLLVPSPYSFIALACIMAFAWQFARRRYHPDGCLVNRRDSRGGPGPARPGLLR
ncbi:MAG: hypothetical protein ACM3N0_12860 [Chloroflexota bacterium]